MTASTLLLYISLALLTQVGLIALYAYVSALNTRKGRAAALASGVPGAKPGEEADPRNAAAWRGLRAFNVIRREYEDAGNTQCSFYLAPVDGAALPAYKPGQFLTFSLTVEREGQAQPLAVTRCYSLSDAPQPNHYRVTIKRVPPPADRPAVPAGVSSNYFHDQVQVGTTLQVRAPSGHFHIDPDSELPVVLIAAGIGITPMVSMLRWCLQHQPARRVHLYYGLRNGDDHAYQRLLKEIPAQSPQVRITVAYSKPRPFETQPGDYQHSGHVDVALLQQTLPHGTHEFYICGPANMMESLVPALSQWGVAASNIHFEAFGPASVRLPVDANTDSAKAPVAAVPIQFRRSGRTLQWSGQESNLLDFAEKHGIAVESGCRSGSCGSCVTSLVQGDVHYATPPDYDLAAGQCLLCVGAPRSALTLEA